MLGGDRTKGQKDERAYPQTKEPSAKKRQKPCRRMDALDMDDFMAAVGQYMVERGGKTGGGEGERDEGETEK